MRRSTHLTLAAGEMGDRGSRGPTARGPKGQPGPPGLPGECGLSLFVHVHGAGAC